jgi:hypothetical protein
MFDPTLATLAVSEIAARTLDVLEHAYKIVEAREVFETGRDAAMLAATAKAAHWHLTHRKGSK